MNSKRQGVSGCKVSSIWEIEGLVIPRKKNGIRGPFLEVLGVSKKKENPIPTVMSLENEDLGDNKVMRVGPL